MNYGRWDELIRAGLALSADDVTRMLAELQTTPTKVEMRVMLIARLRGEARRENLVWLVQNQPGLPLEVAWCVGLDEPDVFTAVRDAWVVAVEHAPRSLDVLTNAAWALVSDPIVVEPYFAKILSAVPADEIAIREGLVGFYNRWILTLEAVVGADLPTMRKLLTDRSQLGIDVVRARAAINRSALELRRIEGVAT